MKIIIDTDKNLLTKTSENSSVEMPLYSKNAFEIVSNQWNLMGWSQKYVYTFTWMGRPIIQLPEDMIRTQEVIYQLQPDYIVETGVAHGGSLMFYASLFKAMGKGQVIGVDIEIRPHNREAIEAHDLFSLITLIEGGSVDNSVIEQVKKLIEPDKTVLVILDSNHSKQHVLDEMNAYAQFVSVGSYFVVTDGIVRDIKDVPRGHEYWKDGNPTESVAAFLENCDDFELISPAWQFNESELTEVITHWPNAWVKRIK